MKKNLAELVFVLDRSGSMAGLESDTIGGFNSMIEKQKKEEGEALITTVLFDSEIARIHDRVPVSRVAPLTDREYSVRGCTALYDAVAGTILHIGNIHRYAREEDVPEKTIIVITTDGMENASRHFSREKVRELIGEKKAIGWEFLFLGANIDVAETAESLGIGKDRSVEYRCDREGIDLNFRTVSNTICYMRSCGTVDADWKKDIEEDRKNRGKE